MSDNDNSSTTETPTRREYVKYGSAVIGGGLLAGCAGSSDSATETNSSNNQDSSNSSDSGSNSSNGSNNSDGGANSSNSSSGGNTTSSGGNSYTVTMAPMGEVEFDSVPQNVMAGSTNYIDMAGALGHGAAVQSSPSASIATPSLEYFYPKLDVSTDWIDFKDTSEYSKETLYELDSDVHFIDPCYLASTDGWDESDVNEIRENVSPFVGNQYSRKHRQPPESCRNSYQYYTVWELTEKYAGVFEEQDRFEQLSEIHQSLVDQIQSALPDRDSRPRVGMVYPRISENAYYVHNLNQPGYFFAHTRPLGAIDVFSDIETDEFGGALVDYETMLEMDPEIIIMNHGISAYYDVPETKKAIRDNNVAQRLTAVENDRLYVSGNPRQGPVMNLFQLEMTAKQFYPEQFGEWPGYVDGEPYPDIATDEQLFDRQRVADIINGDS